MVKRKGILSVKRTNTITAKLGDRIYDTLKKRTGTVVKTGQSGNYNLIYVDFHDGSNILKINPMDDAQRRSMFQLCKEE